jgi:hypothetical protein
LAGLLRRRWRVGWVKDPNGVLETHEISLPRFLLMVSSLLR